MYVCICVRARVWLEIVGLSIAKQFLIYNIVLAELISRRMKLVARAAAEASMISAIIKSGNCSLARA